MNHDLRLMLEAFQLGHDNRAARILKEYVEKRVHSIIFAENFGNIITRPMDGVPDEGTKIPNVYTTKSISKKKKKLPSLKKSVYGTGFAPGAWHGDHDSDGGESGGDGGGGGE